MAHIPVLLNEVLEILKPKAGDTVVDATLGAGGHAQALIKKIGNRGRFLGIDADPEAVARFNKLYGQKNVSAVQGNFRDIAEMVEQSGLKEVDAVLFDLGISSDQLDNPERGFTFQKTGWLDMRLNPKEEVWSAADLLANLPEQELIEIIKKYGEEKNAKRIARVIVAKRRVYPITTTTDLFELIKQSLPAPYRFKAGDAARRTFQALRIRVNNELQVIGQGLAGAFAVLKTGGRLAAISFHSLEDRILKNYFNELARGCVCPPDFPVCICGRSPQAKVLTPKPIRPTLNEQTLNPRSKSAKLRGILKLENS